MANWELWLDDPYGNRLVLLDQVISARAIKTANSIGYISVELPDVYDSYFRLDGVIELWRKPEGGELRLFNTYFLRHPRYYDENSMPITVYGGPDPIHLLKRRIVAYAAGSTQADMTDEADGMMKRIVRDNYTTDATDADRDWTSLGLTVAVDSTDGPTLTMGFSHQVVLDTLRKISNASRKAGTNLYFDFVPTVADDGTLGYDFRTYTSQPGADRTGVDQIIFGPEWGNLEGADLDYDYTDEITVAYAGGQGIGSERVVEEVEDTGRSGASPWGRIEGFTNASGQNSDTDGYYAAGQSLIIHSRAKLKFSGKLLDTEGCRFGIEWNWGDRVFVTYRGRQYEAVIVAVDISLDKRGRETVYGTFEVQDG